MYFGASFSRHLNQALENSSVSIFVALDKIVCRVSSDFHINESKGHFKYDQKRCILFCMDFISLPADHSSLALLLYTYTLASLLLVFTSKPQATHWVSFFYPVHPASRRWNPIDWLWWRVSESSVPHRAPHEQLRFWSRSLVLFHRYRNLHPCQTEYLVEALRRMTENRMRLWRL